jgi:hypothetical protein
LVNTRIPYVVVAGELLQLCLREDGEVLVRRKVGEEPPVDNDGRFAIFGDFLRPTYRVEHEHDFFTAVEILLSIPEWRKPLLQWLESLVFRELTRERYLLSASMREAMALHRHANRAKAAKGSKAKRISDRTLFSVLYGDDYLRHSTHNWARLLAGWSATRGAPFPHEGSYSDWLQTFVRSEYADAIVPAFERYRAERKQLNERNLSMMTLSFDDDFVEKLQLHGLQVAEPGPEIIWRLVYEDTVRPTAKDRAFLIWRCRMGHALDWFVGRDDWARQYERRLQKRRQSTSAWGKRLLVAQDVIEEAIKEEASRLGLCGTGSDRHKPNLLGWKHRRPPGGTEAKKARDEVRRAVDWGPPSDLSRLTSSEVSEEQRLRRKLDDAGWWKECSPKPWHGHTNASGLIGVLEGIHHDQDPDSQGRSLYDDWRYVYCFRGCLCSPWCRFKTNENLWREPRRKVVTMQNGDNKQAPEWRVWNFECYPEGERALWWAAQNGKGTIYASSAKEITQKIRQYNPHRLGRV